MLLIPYFLRIILSILTFLSSLPQIQRIILKKSSADISLFYILLNTISTTEQFTLGFFCIINHSYDSDFFVHDPRNLGDWLNLLQLIIVWLMSLILFALCLFYNPSNAPKGRVVALYVSFLFISVVPLFFDLSIPREGVDKEWYGALFYGIHSMYINPLITLGGIAAFFFQWQQAFALSSVGLAAQAFVFAAVALSWIARVQFIEMKRWGPDFPLKAWYQLVGWAAVNNGIFAIVQAALLYLSRRHHSRKSSEEEPLLSH
ncbi:hypothetical protein EDB81DRAFT_673361 [Dactylonectria macrodidyma]|uniref:Uncharacterized protein n=1 Tax=Dactylonectria macrodidyma TaxID=307937 RepID=A0A9P9FS33_9HYPO|nr:hypothetical protein EDB81DRAFT_673361 [Dactylonectria macrodidyma]